MAYNKKTWLARLGQGLNKFILNGGSKVTLESSPDTVTQQGTPLSAENMNDLEQRIADEFSNQSDAINAISVPINLSSTITINSTYVSNLNSCKVYKIGKLVVASVRFETGSSLSESSQILLTGFPNAISGTEVILASISNNTSHMLIIDGSGNLKNNFNPIPAGELLANFSYISA